MAAVTYPAATGSRMRLRERCVRSRSIRRASQDDSGRSSESAHPSAQLLVSGSSRTATTSVFTGFFIQAPLMKVYTENVYLYTHHVNVGQGVTT